MSILSVQELARPQASQTRDDGSRGLDRGFIVVCNDGSTTETQVLSSASLPAEGDPHPDFLHATCRQRTARRRAGSRTVWDIECNYDSSRTEIKQRMGTSYPWYKRPDISWTTYSVVEALTQDKNGAPIINSAKDPYDPPLEEEFHYPMLNIVRYERRYDIATALAHIDTINQTAITICGLPIAVNQALLREWTGNNILVDGVECWQVTYVLMMHKTVWRKRVLDHGYYYWTANYGVAGSEKKRFKDDEDADSITTDLLNKLGGQGIWSSPQYNEFEIFNETEFGVLNLPLATP